MPSDRVFEAKGRSRRGRAQPLAAIILLLLLGITGGLAGLWGVMWGVQEHWEGRIYPNVHVLGVNLGGLTLDEARAALDGVADRADRGILILTDGESYWQIPWGEAGMQIDMDGTLRAAYAVGHSPGDRHWRRWRRVWRSHHDVRPVLALNLTPARAALERMAPAVALRAEDRSLRRQGDQIVLVKGRPGRELDIEASLEALIVAHQLATTEPVKLAFRAIPPRELDAATLAAMLERLAPEVAQPSGESTLRLEGDQIVLVEARPGRELDVEASLRALIATQERHQWQPVTLALRPISPRELDVAPLQVQVDALLDRQVDLAAYDALRDKTFTWTLDRKQTMRWLRLEPGENGEAYTLRVDEATVRATLETLAAELGEGCGFRMEEAIEEVMAAFRQGGGRVTLYMTHAPRTYIVKSGDTAVKIAAAHGMPLWTLTQANPEVDLSRLQVGQEVVIPTQDILTPHLPVPGKRIVIDLSEQRMRVYEGGGLLHDWLVSTGREGSPTYTGVFQILVKEDSAYASQWDLVMPRFLGIYAAGPGSVNGIHALPILSSGNRLWTGNLGTPVSYGCIILGVEEAETLYAWAEVGVVVVIKE
ncbi:MAG TPA: peptidoglycan binding domain-containing protein [Anaerolineae bacterium]|nr:peptidoglycan binding domain-containing protein [Anaerolineae bacterium]